MISNFLKNSSKNYTKFLPKLFHKNLPIRRLSLHEYQAAELLSKYELPVLLGRSAKSAEEAYQAALELKQNYLDRHPNLTIEDVDYVIKAQVLAGGRGRGHFKESGLQGGVHLLSSPEDVRDYAAKMCGNTLITAQTGPQGKDCSSVYVVERVYMRREHYVALILDRSVGEPQLIVSEKGGMSIEEVDKKYISKFRIPIETGMTPEIALQGAKALRLPSNLLSQGTNAFLNLYRCFMENDAQLIEINPFALTSDQRILICDCKVNIDENSKFRHQDIFKLEDKTQLDPKEIEAEKYDLNYISLDGNIGCMVNGAGLAMATMDLIKYKGGSPANFLDVGGKASDETVFGAMKILNEDPHVEAILVNIFAGIARCDIIALGMIKGIAQLGMRKPIVLRLKGTNIQKAREIIQDSGFNMFLTENLEEAAERVVKMSAILKMAKEIKVQISLTSQTENYKYISLYGIANSISD